MISRRLLANLIVFFLVSSALVGYGVVTLLGNPLRSPMVLTTDFPDASGLVPDTSRSSSTGCRWARWPASP